MLAQQPSCGFESLLFPKHSSCSKLSFQQEQAMQQEKYKIALRMCESYHLASGKSEQGRDLAERALVHIHFKCNRLIFPKISDIHTDLSAIGKAVYSAQSRGGSWDTNFKVLPNYLADICMRVLRPMCRLKRIWNSERYTPDSLNGFTGYISRGPAMLWSLHPIHHGCRLNMILTGHGCLHVPRVIGASAV